MFTGVRVRRAAIDRTLGALPVRWRCVLHGRDRVVIGPTGAFAVADDQPSVSEAAERVAHAAGEIRDFLASVGSWAPFVDPLVVVDGHAEHISRATIVPSRLLNDVLTCGPQQLEDGEITRIADRLGSLRPPRLRTAIH
ncbi:MAG: hypothetical protein JWO37_1097 [Acidimicrobiales bacterium]|jgi:hypothetical protein|nr:hypothetical protein [Acidimicrobiales bacterium]